MLYGHKLGGQGYFRNCLSNGLFFNLAQLSLFIIFPFEQKFNMGLHIRNGFLNLVNFLQLLRHFVVFVILKLLSMVTYFYFLSSISIIIISSFP